MPTLITENFDTQMLLKIHSKKLLLTLSTKIKQKNLQAECSNTINRTHLVFRELGKDLQIATSHFHSLKNKTNEEELRWFAVYRMFSDAASLIQCVVSLLCSFFKKRIMKNWRICLYSDKSIQCWR